MSIRSVYASGKWTDDQRARMAVLERVKKPTAVQRGQLRALRMTTWQDGETRRAEDLARRWEGNRR